MLIEAQKLRRVYGEEDAQTIALAEASLSITKGEFVSIVGASGSGKSTLLHLMGLLDRPSSGKLIFADHDTSQLSDPELAKLRNETIGFVFQSFHLLARTSVLENVLLPLQYSTRPSHEHEKLALDAIDGVGLSHRLHHQPHQLSGGEKQRVAIARALVNKPEIIFADEPTGNLDTKTGAMVMGLVRDIHDAGNTIVLITHEAATAKEAERIVTVSDGTIVSDEAKYPDSLATPPKP